MKKIIVVLLALVIALMAVPVGGASKTVEAQLRPDITFTVNGEEKTYKNSDGEVVAPIVYDGQVYVPASVIKTLTGETAKYDKKTNSLVIGEVKKTESTNAAASSTKVTTGMKNALKAAKNYLKYMAFSYERLVEQLEYDKYSHTEAVYAVDNCGADWYEQATKSAETYLGYMAFSRDGLIRQLEYEGFTHDQAVYGAEANGY